MIITQLELIPWVVDPIYLRVQVLQSQRPEVPVILTTIPGKSPGLSTFRERLLLLVLPGPGPEVILVPFHPEMRWFPVKVLQVWRQDWVLGSGIGPEACRQNPLLPGGEDIEHKVKAKKTIFKSWCILFYRFISVNYWLYGKAVQK